MLHFRSLASGSSGNAYLLRTEKTALLFDAGIRYSNLERFLEGEGLTPDRLTGVLISHEHRDHCVAAEDLARRHGVPVWANEEVLGATGLRGLPSAAVLEVGRPMLFGDVEVTSFPVSHDAVRPVGFMARTQERTLVVATDLGKPTPEVTEAVSLGDLVVIEANHDPEMLWNGSYPMYLRRRVAGPTGHLANEQTADILVKNVRHERVDVWLAHLSKNNNSASVALRTVRGVLKTMGLSGLHVDVARRDRPSLAWNGMPRPAQLSLFSSEI